MWVALGENEGHLALVAPGGEPGLQSHLPVDSLTRGAVAAASLAAALLAAEAGDEPAGVPHVALGPDRIRTALTSDRHFRLDGKEPPGVWAEFSGFWRCGDGWVRTHANYPHHRGRLLEMLGLPTDADTAAFEDRLASLDPLQVEQQAGAVGAIAVAVRTTEEWAAHPQAEAVRGLPLITMRLLCDAEAPKRPTASNPAAPVAGIRVLDLTRVIAGPVATRTLALLGADVLRVDSPALPEVGWQHLDTGAGKRSTLLDLRQAADRRTFDGLLSQADVVVTGYRPDALAAFGLSSEELAERHPGIVVGRISAWGGTGPWGGRRGFDSIVQAASGIGWLESPDGHRPGALPVQALDHTGGYLLAAGVLSSLRRMRHEGGSRLVEVSLARLAQELLALPREPEAVAPMPPAEPTTVTVRAPSGEITYALPALAYEGGPTDWPAPSHPWGSDGPEWATGA
ncbi:CoA transferase [Cryobacterium tepidiphilum]|uniref:CoA transferase n=2 Tax=Cryobacterium tepidiphilum TaxID=2486026 RepID=A0A3M8LBG0_9MICO|nr:CoA transferase [Cryobacterium tepidiphilum]